MSKISGRVFKKLDDTIPHSEMQEVRRQCKKEKVKNIM